jgi:hypothetical protein
MTQIGRPGSLPIFASDTTYDAGVFAWSAQPTKTTIPSGVLAKGIIPESDWPAPYMNWLLNALGRHLEPLVDIGVRNWPYRGWTTTGDTQLTANFGTAIGAMTLNDAEPVWFVGGSTSAAVTERVKRSGDMGVTWRMAAHSNLTGIIGAINDIAGRSGVVIAGGDALASPTRILRSADSGESWALVQVFTIQRDVELFHIVSNSSWLAFGAAGVGGVEFARSTDQGATWTYAPFAPTLGWTTGAVTCVASNGNTVVAAGNISDAVLRSTDGGATWANIPITLGRSSGWAGLVYNSVDGVFLLLSDTGRVAVSSDGATWTNLSSADAFLGGLLADGRGLACIGGTYVAVWNRTIVSSAEVERGILYSTDVGKTWRFVQLFDPHASGNINQIKAADDHFMICVAAGKTAASLRISNPAQLFTSY